MELPTRLLTPQEQAIYLAASPYIDWHDKDIQITAKQLASSANDRVGIAKTCFE